ncbi:hypothetical protein NW762_010674 [Fusarium torreyae]|uniref:Zn(2)-C6 fungal-type domain-containing protein n=1 Tax=Fusarium torreyae TaxID=1237075 RepID=A0A9W8VD36_9HYPO|nr:hypothetical protein NW762_010674 [Fusarium torreyae]
MPNNAQAHQPSSRSAALLPAGLTSPAQIKCNGERPSCVNCQTYDKECVYEPVPDVSKEAGRQRHQRMKRRSNRARTDSTSRARQSSEAASPAGESEAPSIPDEHSQQATREGGTNGRQLWDSTASTDRPMDSGVARVLVLANGESSYHGRTSALFEDNTQERPVEQEVHPRMPDHWVERGLIAEAAKQREYGIKQ